MATIKLIPANEKKQMVIFATEASNAAYVAEKALAFTRLQDKIALAIAEAADIPIKLDAHAYDSQLCVDRFDFGALSAWLKNAGYCLDIVYMGAGNDGIIDWLTVGYYEECAWLLEEKAIRVSSRASRGYRYY